MEALQRTLLALQETGQELSRGNLQLRDYSNMVLFNEISYVKLLGYFNPNAK